MAGQTPPHPSPLRGENLHLAIVILGTTGMRLGELVRLTLGDCDPREQTLLIRDSKFYRSRLVLLSIDGARNPMPYALHGRLLRGRLSESTQARTRVRWTSEGLGFHRRGQRGDTPVYSALPAIQTFFAHEACVPRAPIRAVAEARHAHMSTVRTMDIRPEPVVAFIRNADRSWRCPRAPSSSR